MPMEPFDELHRVIALSEMRVCEAPHLLERALPTKYFLREWYCTEPDCDCRRVLVQFLGDAPDAGIAASINFGWEKPSYYKTWSSFPDLWQEMAGATLEPFAEQGPDAELFLLIFQTKIMSDPEIVAAFRRHYQLVKDNLKPPSRAEGA